MLSILLPSYNNRCYDVVDTLQRQASVIDGLQYEIIVADDGGDDLDIKECNKAINDLPNCRYIIRERNIGRAAIRNFLASQAKYEWLLFLDSDINIDDESFVRNYIEGPKDDLVCGGVRICHNDDCGSNLRYRYEHAEEHNHTEDKRNKNTFASFRTTNFMIRRSVMNNLKFDERFTRYGYEDVMYGRQLKENGFHILHIDNPVTYTHFEDNPTYLSKIEEALTTLHFFRTELEGYSPLNDMTNRLRRWQVLWLIRLWHRIFHSMEKSNLIGHNPSLTILSLYKLGYFASLK